HWERPTAPRRRERYGWPRRSVPGSRAATWCGWSPAAPRRPCRRCGGGGGGAPPGLPASAGVPPAAVAETMVVPYNVVPAIGDDVACVIVEPVAANMGLVPPRPR